MPASFHQGFSVEHYVQLYEAALLGVLLIFFTSSSSTICIRGASHPAKSVFDFA